MFGHFTTLYMKGLKGMTVRYLMDWLISSIFQSNYFHTVLKIEKKYPYSRN